MSAKHDALRSLYDRVEAPTRDALGRTRANFVRGAGNPDSPIVFIGEAPGLDEDRQKTPFIGRAGRKLNEWLESVGLRRESVYITNLVKCHPMKNPSTPDARSNDRPPTPAEVAICWPILEEELQIIKPQVIVTMGSPATRTLLKTKETITALRGRLHPFPGHPMIQVFPIYHPAATFHNPRLTPDVLKDLDSLKRCLQDGMGLCITKSA